MWNLTGLAKCGRKCVSRKIALPQSWSYIFTKAHAEIFKIPAKTFMHAKIKIHAELKSMRKGLENTRKIWKKKHFT